MVLKTIVGVMCVLLSVMSCRSDYLMQLDGEIRVIILALSVFIGIALALCDYFGVPNDLEKTEPFSGSSGMPSRHPTSQPKTMLPPYQASNAQGVPDVHHAFGVFPPSRQSTRPQSPKLTASEVKFVKRLNKTASVAACQKTFEVLNRGSGSSKTGSD